MLIKRSVWQFVTAGFFILLVLACSPNDGPTGPIPVIESFSPQSGRAPLLVTLYGVNFGESPDDITVKFNGAEADLISITPTELMVGVPAGSTTGRISVTVKGVTGISQEDFNIIPPPSISSFAPTTGHAGSQVVITGSGFSTPPSENVVKFGAYTATILEGTTSSLTVAVPFGASTAKISVTNGGLSSTSTANFTITNPWVQKADYAGLGDAFAVAFTIGTKGYVGTGYTNDFWEYNPSTNAWTQKADFPGTARSEAVGFGIGTKGYVGTGYSATNSGEKDFWEYDPATNTWTRKTDFGGTGRRFATGFVVQGKGYISGGLDYSTGATVHLNNDLWEYNPANDSWSKKTDFPGTPRYLPTSFAIGDRGYVGTGKDTDTYTKDFYEYNPASNTWRRIADLPENNRSNAVGFAIGNKGYVGMSENYNADFWEYNPSLDRWIRKADFPNDGRKGAVAFAVGGKGYVGMGTTFFNSTLTRKDIWEFSPE